MYIRESKTKNKKTGKVYIKHSLVESVSTANGPRQKLIMTLGYLTLDRSLWKELSLALELYLHGGRELEKLSLFELEPELLDEITKQRAAIRFHKNKLAKESNTDSKISNKDIQKVDINTLTQTESRSLGPELLVNDAWEQLGFKRILKDCDFTDKEIALAASVIWGRLISPGSDYSTWKWLRESTSLPEFFDVDISRVHKDKIYEISDRLLSKKDILEKKLYQNQTELFNLQQTLFLFDLTNFYFEGNAYDNELAHRGKSKEKRNQNALVSLALIVDEYGFPVKSKVYKGNVSEPTTLEEILTEMGLFETSEALPFRPTLAMDRGIATEDNIAFIKSKKFPYTVIQRADKSIEFKKEFEQMKGFSIIKDSKEQVIHLKRIDNQLLCVSESRADKEDAMYERKSKKIKKDLDALNKSINTGKVKDSKKIHQRIGRIKGRYPGFDKFFEVNFKNKKLVYKNKSEKDTLAGCYVIEHSNIGNDEETIWRTYTTLTRVEAAFRSLKTELGTRPIFHQGAERTSGHLFISILAYHMLINIEHRLRLNGTPAYWITLKKQLRHHCRSVLQWKNELGNIKYKKVSSRPEPHHLDIYRKLNIINPLKDLKYE